MRRQRAAGAQVGADQQRIDHAGGGAGVGEAFVATRRHARQREGGTAKHASEAGDFLDIGRGITAHAGGIMLVYGINLIAADVLAIGSSDAEVPSDGFEAVSGELARGKIVPQHGVHRIDQLTARHDEADAASVVAIFAATLVPILILMLI